MIRKGFEAASSCHPEAIIL